MKQKSYNLHKNKYHRENRNYGRGTDALILFLKNRIARSFDFYSNTEYSDSTNSTYLPYKSFKKLVYSNRFNLMWTFRDSKYGAMLHDLHDIDSDNVARLMDLDLELNRLSWNPYQAIRYTRAPEMHIYGTEKDMHINKGCYLDSGGCVSIRQFDGEGFVCKTEFDYAIRAHNIKPILEIACFKIYNFKHIIPIVQHSLYLRSIKYMFQSNYMHQHNYYIVKDPNSLYFKLRE